MNATTRISLIHRIRQSDDVDAWSQFVDIYGPLIYRFGRRKGLQDADATDLTQDVLTEVSKSIGRFNYDPNVGRFRSWLFVIAHRAFVHRSRKGKRQPVGSGDTATIKTLEDVAAQDEEDRWGQEYRQHLFSWACEQVRGEFTEKTWGAFWKTAVDGLPPTDVAAELELSVGAVYVAKNRVVTRLREKIRYLDESVEI